jgi:hypothetical protein
VILLEAAAGQLGNLAYSSKSDLFEVNQSLRAKATIAVRRLSEALAAERCKNRSVTMKLETNRVIQAPRNFDSLPLPRVACYRRLIVTFKITRRPS